MRHFPNGPVTSGQSDNPIVKVYIMGETLIWSAWNFIMPIFGIYVTTAQHGTVDNAATAYSIYLIVRVIFELASGRYLVRKKLAYKFLMTVFGIAVISVSYIGLAFSQLIPQLYLFFGMIGMGIGIASPAKNSLFSAYLDREKESSQWGSLDASVFLSMALASVVGGFIARDYGFSVLFFVAAIVNAIGLLPYLLYVKRWKRNIEETLLS
jgi:MFS family permease